MLQLPDILKSRGKIRFRQEFCDDIDIQKQNIRNIRTGIQHFTVTHIQNACKKYGIDANWIMGIHTNIFNGKPLTKKLTTPPIKRGSAKNREKKSRTE